MSRPRKSRRTARDWARRLGAADGIAHVDDFAETGGQEEIDGYSLPAPASAADLWATLRAGTASWDEGAAAAGAAGLSGCPSGFEPEYYAAYERAARQRAKHLALSLEVAS